MSDQEVIVHGSIEVTIGKETYTCYPTGIDELLELLLEVKAISVGVKLVIVAEEDIDGAILQNQTL